MSLPIVVFTGFSEAALSECKLFAQAACGVLLLVGLAASERASAARMTAFPLWCGRWLTALLVLVLISAIAAWQRVDPLTFVAISAPIPFFLVGASSHGSGLAPAALRALAGLGVLTGLLAVGQRAGLLPRLPTSAPEPRFLATALIGNPGYVAATLVVPSLLFLVWLSSAETSRRRCFAALGLLTTLSGLGVTQTVAPLLAVGTGFLIHLLFDFRRRFKMFAVALGLLVAAGTATGLTGRVLSKWRELRSGQVATAVTQRDIGFLAAAEMIRAHPLLGVGPGLFEAEFVPARLRAEERVRRRLIHRSDSAHFENAHSDPLTVAAECGIPAGLLAFGLFFALIRRLLTETPRQEPRESPASRELLLILLPSLFVLSLGSFPLRLPVLAGPTAFLLGLAWARAGSSDAGARLTTPALLRGFAIVLGLAASARAASVLLQGSGEMALREAVLVQPGALRDTLLAQAERRLQWCIRSRPRNAPPRIALGSIHRIERRLDAAWTDLQVALHLAERAEIDLNLGRVALESGDVETARRLFLRAVWILPRLAQALPPDPAFASIEQEVATMESELGTGAGLPPALPAALAKPVDAG